MANVENYASQHNLSEHVAILKKGALVAQNPAGFELMDELDEVEKEHLRAETLHKWRQPKTLYLIIALSSIGAAIQGWDRE